MKAKTASTMFDSCLISPDFALIQIINNAFKIAFTGKVTTLTIMTKIKMLNPERRVATVIDHTRHFCMRYRVDGVKAMSRGISGGKQKTKCANTRNHGAENLLTKFLGQSYITTII